MKKIYTIGRDEECDIVIPDRSDVISRLHATIRIESDNKIFLIDQSRNGTYVNGMKMSSNVEIPVSRNDVISFAHLYNLDWSMIPKSRGGVYKTIFIVIFGILFLAGIVFAAIKFFKKPVQEVQPEVEQTIPADTNTLNEGKDTIVDEPAVEIKAPVVIPSDKRHEKKVAKQDTVSQDTIEEVIYDPIY